MEPGITWYEVLGAWEVLGNLAIRERYDVAAGFRRRGSGLAAGAGPAATGRDGDGPGVASAGPVGAGPVGAGPVGAQPVGAQPAGSMRALVFRHSLAREAASAIGGRVDPRAFVSRFAPVRIEDVDELPLPASDWVRVQTTFSGLCGSDVKQILLNGSRDNPLTALVSFPHVLGHEVVGRRTDTNERVVLNP